MFSYIVWCELKDILIIIVESLEDEKWTQHAMRCRKDAFKICNNIN